MQELTQGIVAEWIKGTTGVFGIKDIHNELDIGSDKGKAHLRVILYRLAKEGMIIPVSGKDGFYRLIDIEAPDELWQGTKTKGIALKFPFELERYIRILPKSLIIVAGAPGAGKTALLYNIAYLNMYEFIIHIFNSEMGLAQIDERFNAINSGIPNPAPFRVRHREDNFAEVVEPDAINLIDYLDIDATELYMIGAELKKILHKLNQGVAIVAIQKPIGRDLGYGAGFSLKGASLYLSMDSGKLKIIKARERADNKVNPVNKTWSFHLDNTGANFIIDKEWIS